jgi:hypothetical protein
MQPKKYYLFNFSASYSGGGYKRLHEYAKEFNFRGGARFIIHPRCSALAQTFPNNIYHVIEQSALRRVLKDFRYLEKIVAANGVPHCYYSYGIPIHFKVAAINWFHLSNVLPLAPQGIPMAPLDYMKMRILGGRIRKQFVNADVISAESHYSLELLGSHSAEVEKKLFLSVNGSNDEIALLREPSLESKRDTAVVLGTYRYKALEDSFRVFEMLRVEGHSDLKLVIVGLSRQVPKYISSNPNVVVTGFIARDDLIDLLRKTRYYISTTLIENSYNAASEGVFFAEESYISSIGPHLELMRGMHYETISIPSLSRSMLHINRSNVTGANIISWEEVVSAMIVKVNEVSDREFTHGVEGLQ